MSDIGIFFAYDSPTGAESGSAFSLLSIVAPIPPLTFGPKKLNLPEPAILPDPRIFCCHGQQIRVLQLDGRFYTFQDSKGVVGKFT